MTKVDSQRNLRENRLADALACLNGDDLPQARSLALSAIDLGLDNVSSWTVLSLACRDLGLLDEAEEAADKAIQHEPLHFRAHVVKGDVFYSRGHRRTAAAFYRTALSIIQRSPNISLSSVAQKEHDRASDRVRRLHEQFEQHLLARTERLLSNVSSTQRMQAAVDLLVGRRKLYLPEPRHMLFPGLPIHEFYPNAMFDWIATLEKETQVIQSELARLMEKGVSFSPYLTTDGKQPVFDNHGMANNDDWGAIYLWKNGQPISHNQELCPQTTSAMKQLPLVYAGKRCPNILFSRLKPGAKIPPHHGMTNSRLIGHLPLVVPTDCGFRVGNEVKRWEIGKVFLFDDTIEHEAWNLSTSDRVILIFEVWKPELEPQERQLVTELLCAVDDF